MGQNGRNMGTEKEKPTMWEWGVILLIYCYNKLIEKQTENDLPFPNGRIKDMLTQCDNISVTI